MEKTLIISPHADDVLFGAFSFLKESEVLICSMDESRCPKDKHRLDIEKKIAETTKAIGQFDYIDDIPVNELYIEKYWLIQKIEEKANKSKPTIVLIPHPSYNQDHQAVYDACMVALRPHDKNHFVNKVLVYDVYDYTKWGTNQMVMNYFKEVDIKAKLKAYKSMKSQVRSYRTPAQLKAWAKAIGEKCNLKYAEGFKLIRGVDGSTDKL